MLNMLHKVQDRPDLVKDSHSKALLKVDKTAIRRHQHHMAGVLKEQDRDDEIKQLRSDVDAIKGLLEKILGKL